MSFVPDDVLARLGEAIDLPEFADPRYRALRRLGSGGMGTVFEALDSTLDRTVAIKVVAADRADPAFEARLEREARTIARLEHPGIVPIHDFGRTVDGRAFYVMKRIEGRTLDAALRDLPARNERLRLFLRLCDVIAFAHTRGVVHRDIKPANVMVGAFGELYVMDWGIAKDVAREVVDIAASDNAARAGAADGADTGHGAILGTPSFMAPEQARGESATVDERADVHALGALLRVLVSDGIGPPGDAPFATKRSDRPLHAIITRATAASPDQRYPAVRDLAADVARFLDGLAVDAYAESWIDKTGRIARRHGLVIGLIAAYLLLRALAIVFAPG